MKNFIISTLATVGFSEDAIHENSAFTEPEHNSHAFNSILERKLSFTLVGHRSHASHSSHGSHRSSASSSRTYKAPTTPTVPSTSTRNKNSTPPSSILPSSPALNLEKLNGNSAKFVKLTIRVQMLLYAYGFYTGEINGIVNTETSVALSKYQKANGLKVTGKIDNPTVKMMNVSVD